jgi:hypothetical protein
MAQRYCTNCGAELREDDSYCSKCGGPLHKVATVSTPEADVLVPPPPQQAEDRSVPPQDPQASSGDEQVRSATRGPMWTMLAVFLVLGIVEIVQEIVQGFPAVLEAKDIGFQIGVQIGTGIGRTINAALATAVIILVVGAIYYATARKRGVTFREAVFNWPMVILAGLLASGSLL